MTTQIVPTIHTIVESPVGPLTLVASDGILLGLYLDQQRCAPDRHLFGERRPDCLPEVRRQLWAYFDRTLTGFTVPIAPRGTAFQRRVWSALCAIPYGQTTTYGQLAALIGLPTASRAVGLANGRNPIGIIIPCHRVLGVNNALTGYGGGLERKEALLCLEARAKR
jgi:methylated-DNA-[protein]-cysteine S-methyltransferase